MKHSVILEYKRCRGCTTCIKNCPTEAVRVRSGKATILNERCIDCGKCSTRCPYQLDTPKLLKYMLEDYNEFYETHKHLL